MEWFKKFMQGRSGGDQLSIALIVLAALLNLTAPLTGLPLIGLLGYLPLGIAVFRTLSRNIPRRRMENYQFSIMISPVYSWLKITRNRLRDIKTHRYFACPNCRQSLRVPKGKGKIIVICPKCKTEFGRKT